MPPADDLPGLPEGTASNALGAIVPLSSAPPPDAGAQLGSVFTSPGLPGAGATGGAAGFAGTAGTAGGGGATGEATRPQIAYRGEEEVTPERLVAPIGRVISTVPDAMWVAIAALLALSLLFAGTTVLATVRALRRDQVIRDMELLAFTDSLTGVLNRGALEQALGRELARARRYGRPLAILLIDVDNLKAVNDRHGHAAGDELLRSVGLTLSDTIRDHDVCGRLGGDEYVVGVVEEGPDGAINVLTRIQRQLATRRTDLDLTTAWGISAGMASYPEDGDTVADLVAAADRRLYASRGIDIEPT